MQGILDDDEMVSMFSPNYVPSIPPMLKDYIPSSLPLLSTSMCKLYSNDTSNVSNSSGAGYLQDFDPDASPPPDKLILQMNGLDQDSNEEDTSSLDSTLRKGKWTAEEEEFTSKIIYYFNNGILQLPEGTTLRTYLADKLQCDPMRITKKFTGSQCLGKRLYHQCEVLQVTNSQVQAAMNELAQLEHRFKIRLEREKLKSRNEIDNESQILHAGNVVSSPAIDAMVLQSRGITSWHAAPCHPDLPFQELPFHAFQLVASIERYNDMNKLPSQNSNAPSIPDSSEISGFYAQPRIDYGFDMNQRKNLMECLPSNDPLSSFVQNGFDTGSHPQNFGVLPCIQDFNNFESPIPTVHDASGLLMGFFNQMTRSNSQNDLVQFAVEMSEAAQRVGTKQYTA